jgi:excisionase family DNA binding protein
MPIEKPVGQGETIEPELLNATQAAVLLGCSERHVHALVQRGHMPKPTVTRGRRRYWYRRLLKDWIEAGCPAIEKEGKSSP